MSSETSKGGMGAAINEAAAEMQSAYPENCYYDINSRDYYMPRPQGGWLKLGEGPFKRQLRSMGYKGTKDKDDTLSQVDNALVQMQLNAAVDYAGPLAGYSEGLYKMEGHDVLVTRSPQIIKPAPGTFNRLFEYLFNMLAPDENFVQLDRLYGWLKVYLESLYAQKPRTGHVLMLAGLPDSGKSLLQYLLTPMMGGRSAKPYQFAIGGTSFNSDLFFAEHLLIEDESPSQDMRVRRQFGAFCKGVAANQVQRMHKKNSEPIMLRPLQRMTVSVNSEPEHIGVLPPLDESLIDKVILLHCHNPPEPLNDGTPAAREEFFNDLCSELPAFIHMLLNEWEIADDIRCTRFGVKSYINPEIAELVLSLSDEIKMIGLVDRAGILKMGRWEGTAQELQTALLSDEDVGYEARSLLRWHNACGTFLSRLKNSLPKRVKCLGRTNRQHTYRIYADKDSEIRSDNYVAEEG